MEIRESTHVGDLNSDAKGTGARKNEGKVTVDLLTWMDAAFLVAPQVPTPIYKAMFALGEYQESHEVSYLRAVVSHLYDGDIVAAMYDAARVFEFGSKKYKAWNWAKGMPWSVPLGCIGRHLLKLAKGEELDPETGLSHRGHVVCNVFMLISYATHYPEGNDLPKVFSPITYTVEDHNKMLDEAFPDILGAVRG